MVLASIILVLFPLFFLSVFLTCVLLVIVACIQFYICFIFPQNILHSSIVIIAIVLNGRVKLH